MLKTLLLLTTLTYEPRNWLHYPSINEIKSVTFSNRSLFIAVPGGIYILDLRTFRHQRTITAADGIEGEILFAAFNPSGHELLIVSSGHLYQFLPLTQQIYRLNPPFKQVHSIGIARNGTFLETEMGLFQKIGGADRYTPARNINEPVTWYGAKDTGNIRGWTFLTPYYITDEELNIYPLTKAYPDPQNQHLLVVSPNYGIIVYHLKLGIKEKTIRLGPPAEPIKAIFKINNQLWFFTETRFFFIDSTGNWHFPSTHSRDAAIFAQNFLASQQFWDLNQQEKIKTILPFPGELLIGTTTTLYRLNNGERPTPVARLNTPINAIARFQDSILIGTNDGLFLLTPDSLTQVSDPFARFDFGVYNISQTRGVTFFGTQGRILRLDPDNTWTQLIPPGFDLSQPVRTMTAQKDFLFVASGQQISIYRLTDHTWQQLTPQQGLIASPITALYADETYLWIASPGLISRYEYSRQLR